MADRYSAKEYVDAIASEIDEAAKAALDATRTLIETVQNTEQDLAELKSDEEKEYMLASGFLYISPAMVSLELAVNNIERLLNIMNITASLKGLEPKEASVIDKEGYSIFNYYIPFVDDEYVLLDYYESIMNMDGFQNSVQLLEKQLKDLKSIAMKIMSDYGNIVVRRKGREK